MANEKRNASIDITKFILALIVVMLHSATECLGTEHMAVRGDRIQRTFRCTVLSDGFRVLFYENVSGKGNRFFEIFRADDEDLSALVSRLHFS